MGQRVEPMVQTPVANTVPTPYGSRWAMEADSLRKLTAAGPVRHGEAETRIRQISCQGAHQQAGAAWREKNKHRLKLKRCLVLVGRPTRDLRHGTAYREVYNRMVNVAIRRVRRTWTCGMQSSASHWTGPRTDADG